MLKLDIEPAVDRRERPRLYAVLRKFLFKPVQDVIAKRQQMVDANLADAETSKKEAAETMNAAQENCVMWTMKPQPAAKPTRSRPRSKSSSCWQIPQKQADAIVAAGKAAPRPNARASCGKPMPRPRHWPARCARSCWPAI